MPRSAIFALVVAAGLVFAVGPAATSAAASPGVTVAAAIDGHDVSRSSNGHPIVLHPTTPATLDLTITNHTSTPIEIRTVRLSGHVMGLTFYSYDITVDTTVDVDATVHLGLPVDLGGLRGQATGLIAGSVQLLAAGSAPIASVAMVSDVRGSAHSVYGVFGIAIAIIAALGIGGALLGLARGTLPVNRFLRALRFGAPFAALGLLIVFTLSAFRILVPKATSEIPIVAVTTVAGFIIGYLTPNPLDDDDDGETMREEPAGTLLDAPAMATVDSGARITVPDAAGPRPTDPEPLGDTATQPTPAVDSNPGSTS